MRCFNTNRPIDFPSKKITDGPMHHKKQKMLLMIDWQGHWWIKSINATGGCLFLSIHPVEPIAVTGWEPGHVAKNSVSKTFNWQCIVRTCTINCIIKKKGLHNITYVQVKKTITKIQTFCALIIKATFEAATCESFDVKMFKSKACYCPENKTNTYHRRRIKLAALMQCLMQVCWF